MIQAPVLSVMSFVIISKVIISEVKISIVVVLIIYSIQLYSNQNALLKVSKLGCLARVFKRDCN
jgi:hypothetical protein